MDLQVFNSVNIDYKWKLHSFKIKKVIFIFESWNVIEVKSRNHIANIQIAREETCCRHTGYSFQLADRLIYTTTCHGALAGTRNSSMGPLHEGSIRWPIAPWVNSYHGATSRSLPTDRTAHTTAFITPVVDHWLERETAQWVHPMKDRSDDPSHHERTLLPSRS